MPEETATKLKPSKLEKMEYTREEYLSALKIVATYKDQLATHYEEVEKECKEVNRFLGVTKDTLLSQYGLLEVRTLNALKSADVGLIKVGDLEGTEIKFLRRLRCFGAKSLQEVKELCYFTGVNLIP